MKIGLFPLWAGDRIGGISTYDSRLLPALSDAAPHDEFHVYSPNAHAIGAAPEGRANVTHHRLFPRSRWLNVPFSFPIAAAFSPVDLLHMTHVPPPISPRPYVMTLHCFSTFAHPEFYPRGLGLRINALVRRGLASARLVVCVSQGLRDLAQRELEVHPDRLAVAYNGVSDEFRPLPKAQAAAAVRTAYGLEGPYLLFVGVMAPRKNVARIVEAFGRYRRQAASGLKLALVGRRWIADDVDEAVKGSGVAEDVVFIDHVENGRLPELYCAAEMLVFPSLWESFGIPVVESMACGTPVLTSRGSCLPEIAGDAAVYVDPYSVTSIADGIASVMEDASLAGALRARGLARAGGFRWRDTAVQTLAAYRQAMAV